MDYSQQTVGHNSIKDLHMQAVVKNSPTLNKVKINTEMWKLGAKNGHLCSYLRNERLRALISVGQITFKK